MLLLKCAQCAIHLVTLFMKPTLKTIQNTSYIHFVQTILRLENSRPALASMVAAADWAIAREGLRVDAVQFPQAVVAAGTLDQRRSLVVVGQAERNTANAHLSRATLPGP